MQSNLAIYAILSQRSYVKKFHCRRLVKKIGLFILVLGYIVPSSIHAQELSLPALFSDNMVIQRNMNVPIWGTAQPGEVVEVIFQDDRFQTVVDQDGKWRVFMNAYPAGGPYQLQVIAGDTLIFNNVMSGEVWVASGQSNMEMPLAGWGEIKNYKEEIANADYPNIRLLQVNRATSNELVSGLSVDEDQWLQVSPTSIPEFSSTAYFFGRNLYKTLDVPIGLIHSSWGGTVAEAWTSGSTLKTMPDFKAVVEKMEAGPQTQDKLIAKYEQDLANWEEEVKQQDSGYDTEGEARWASGAFNESNWKQMNLPSAWENRGLNNFDGVVWYRKKVNVTNPDHEYTLRLGPVDDNDITWFNGQKIGTTDGWTNQREYTIPSQLVQKGENVIAVRVFDTGGEGGFRGEEESLLLIDNETSKAMNLGGKWKYQTALALNEMPMPPQPPNTPNRPTVLYNAMINPLMPYAMRGVIWYQGESNAGRAQQYRTLFPLLIKDWREQWGEGEFPFLFVQLANFMARKEAPGPSQWAELRDAQLHALSLPNTGMAVAIDIGNAEDIHPKNKQEVGRRLALIARSSVYGEALTFSGPIYRSMQKTEEGRIRLSFNHVGNGLTIKGSEELKGFAVAGADEEFHWARAKIVGDQVEVWSPQVDKPVAVRYGWADNPDVSLYNEAGLPASPFRTDSW